MDRISQMIGQIKRELNGIVDLPGTISRLVKQAVEQDADPYTTLGVLLESIAYALALTIPGEKKG